MQIKRRILTAGTTFFLAAATGHLMQNGGAISARFLPGSDVSTASVAAPVPLAKATLDQTSIVPVSAGPQDTAIPKLPDLPDTTIPALASGMALAPRMIRVERGYARRQTAADVRYSAFGLACSDPALTLTAKPGGMIGVTVAAPCQPGARAEVSAAGLVFDTLAGRDGSLRLDVPAFAALADVTVAFPDGTAASGQIAVPDVLTMRRIAVQWTGTQRLQLDVFENGAAWGEDGHVSAASEPEPGLGGVLSLGDPSLAWPKLALVYSGAGELSSLAAEVSSEVTSATCGREIAGEVLRPGASALPVSLRMPDCDGAGGYVVINVDTTAPTLPLSVASN
ncbi:MAG: hypothetical protein ACKVPY_12105 [Paracoccaceae bacterium]